MPWYLFIALIVAVAYLMCLMIIGDRIWKKGLVIGLAVDAAVLAMGLLNKEVVNFFIPLILMVVFKIVVAALAWSWIHWLKEWNERC